MTKARPAVAALAALVLSACATAVPTSGTYLSLASLPGWAAEDHAAAFAAVRADCRYRAAVLAACSDILAAGDLPEGRARAFLERRLRAQPIDGEGLLTGYFSPVYEARRAPDGNFTAPLRPPPANPANAGDRIAIEARPAPDALAWLKPEDLFFLQIQGSGVLDFPNGRSQRAVFAGSNGQSYLAIGGPMLRRRLFDGENASARSVHGWLAAHRGRDAEEIMRLNPRYVFFRLTDDDGTEPKGAAGVALTAGRSLAVDPKLHSWGDIFWIDGEAPALAGARPAYRRLAVALDTGGAIRGEVRADLYLGRGDAAGEEAGRVHHTLRLWRLVPARP